MCSAYKSVGGKNKRFYSILFYSIIIRLRRCAVQCKIYYIEKNFWYKYCRPYAAPPPSLLANEGLVQPANERPVCCAGGIWITRAVGTVRNLAYLAFACQMRWTGEVSIIITLDWEKRIRVVKLCMTFESGPECKLTLF